MTNAVLQHPSPLAPECALAKLLNHACRLQTAVGSLDRGCDLFEECEPSAKNGIALRMFRPKGVKTEDEIRLFNEELVQYVWHWKDYVQLFAVEHRGLTAAQAKKYIEKKIGQSRSLKLCGYIANFAKHGQVTKYPHFAKEEPRLREAVLWFQHGPGEFDNAFVPVTGTTDIQTSFAVAPIQTVYIWDKAGKTRLGHTRFIVEEAAQVWVGILSQWGVNL